MEFDTLAYLATPERQMLAGIILSTDPAIPFTIARDTVSGRAPHQILAAVASGLALLSVEMIHRDGAGAAGRSRFGVDAPAPLAAVAPGALALSDIVLTSALGGEEAPATFAAMLPRMLRSTLLRDPKQTALFWELYGLGTGDTATISLRIVRKDDDNILQRLGTRLGVGKSGDDSLVVQWTEPRPSDPTATLEGGVTIRPRGNWWSDMTAIIVRRVHGGDRRPTWTHSAREGHFAARPLPLPQPLRPSPLYAARRTFAGIAQFVLTIQRVQESGDRGIGQPGGAIPATPYPRRRA